MQDQENIRKMQILWFHTPAKTAYANLQHIWENKLLQKCISGLQTVDRAAGKATCNPTQATKLGSKHDTAR